MEAVSSRVSCSGMLVGVDCNLEDWECGSTVNSPQLTQTGWRFDKLQWERRGVYITYLLYSDVSVNQSQPSRELRNPISKCFPSTALSFALKAVFLYCSVAMHLFLYL